MAKTKAKRKKKEAEKNELKLNEKCCNKNKLHTRIIFNK